MTVDEMGEAPTMSALEDRDIMCGVNEYMRDSLIQPPAIFFEDGTEYLGDSPLPKESYISREYAAREWTRLWTHVWQMACRERAVAEPGMFTTYEIGDQSILITRDAGGQLRAFHNVCLHRGTRLMEGSGDVGPNGSFSCPFHAWTWNTDGTLKRIPCAWDFPKVEPGEYGLRPVQVDVWDGWVFINMDLEAAPLAKFLGDTLPRHFRQWPIEKRRLAAHGGKVLNCNWKAALEAFMETYHVFRTHPQAMLPGITMASKYDQWGDNARMLHLMISNPLDPDGPPDAAEHVAMVSEMNTFPDLTKFGIEPEPGETPRRFLARAARVTLGNSYSMDMSNMSDVEVLDTIEYFVFPNFIVWGGYANPLVYRCRPNGNDPDSCFFEAMLVTPDGENPRPDVEMTLLSAEQKWSDVPNFSGLGPILDQDESNLARVQRGLHSEGITTVTFSEAQESNIRVLHRGVVRYTAESG